MAAMLGPSSMALNHPAGGSRGVTDALVAPIRTKDLREQARTVDAAIAHKVSYGFPASGAICIEETKMPKKAVDIPDANLAAGKYLSTRCSAWSVFLN